MLSPKYNCSALCKICGREFWKLCNCCISIDGSLVKIATSHFWLVFVHGHGIKFALEQMRKLDGLLAQVVPVSPVSLAGQVYSRDVFDNLSFSVWLCRYTGLHFRNTDIAFPFIALTSELENTITHIETVEYLQTCSQHPGSGEAIDLT